MLLVKLCQDQAIGPKRAGGWCKWEAESTGRHRGGTGARARARRKAGGSLPSVGAGEWPWHRSRSWCRGEGLSAACAGEGHSQHVPRTPRGSFRKCLPRYLPPTQLSPGVSLPLHLLRWLLRWLPITLRVNPKSPSLTLQVNMCTGVPRLGFWRSCSGHAQLLECSQLSRHLPLPGSLPSTLATL